MFIQNVHVIVVFFLFRFQTSESSMWSTNLTQSTRIFEVLTCKSRLVSLKSIIVEMYVHSFSLLLHRSIQDYKIHQKTTWLSPIASCKSDIQVRLMWGRLQTSIHIPMARENNVSAFSFTPSSYAGPSLDSSIAFRARNLIHWLLSTLSPYYDSFSFVVLVYDTRNTVGVDPSTIGLWMV